MGCALALVVLGCSGAQNKEKESSDWDPADSSGGDEVASSSGGDGSGDSGDSGSGDSGAIDGGDGDETPAPKPKPPPGADDYDLTYSDCRALAATYRGAWLSEELTKLNAKKLNEKAFEKAKAQVEKSAEEAGENWRSACDSIVGSPFLYSRLKCAMKAKAVQRFDDCWDGKVEE
jgi:hypothetical protein